MTQFYHSIMSKIRSLISLNLWHYRIFYRHAFVVVTCNCNGFHVYLGHVTIKLECSTRFSFFKTLSISSAFNHLHYHSQIIKRGLSVRDLFLKKRSTIKMIKRFDFFANEIEYFKVFNRVMQHIEM